MYMNDKAIGNLTLTTCWPQIWIACQACNCFYTCMLGMWTRSNPFTPPQPWVIWLEVVLTTKVSQPRTFMSCSTAIGLRCQSSAKAIEVFFRSKFAQWLRELLTNAMRHHQVRSYIRLIFSFVAWSTHSFTWLHWIAQYESVYQENGSFKNMDRSRHSLFFELGDIASCEPRASPPTWRLGKKHSLWHSCQTSDRLIGVQTFPL